MVEQILPQLLLEVDHLEQVLVGGGGHSQVQRVGHGRHLAHEFVVREHAVPLQVAVVEDALAADGQLQGGSRLGLGLGGASIMEGTSWEGTARGDQPVEDS